MADGELNELARDLDRCCRLHGEFVLRSGRTAAEYFDKYLFESDPQLLRRVVERMVGLIPPGTEMLGGLELGGIPLATMLSSLTGLPALFIRKQAKDYGTRRLAEGGDPARRSVLLVEDVITTGGAVRAAADALRSMGAVVTHVVCAIDRSDPGSHPLAEAAITVAPVVTKDVLDAAAAGAAPGPEPRHPPVPTGTGWFYYEGDGRPAPTAEQLDAAARVDNERSARLGRRWAHISIDVHEQGTASHMGFGGGPMTHDEVRGRHRDIVLRAIEELRRQI